MISCIARQVVPDVQRIVMPSSSDRQSWTAEGTVIFETSGAVHPRTQHNITEDLNLQVNFLLNMKCIMWCSFSSHCELTGCSYMETK